MARRGAAKACREKAAKHQLQLGQCQGPWALGFPGPLCHKHQGCCHIKAKARLAPSPISENLNHKHLIQILPQPPTTCRMGVVGRQAQGVK